MRLKPVPFSCDVLLPGRTLHVECRIWPSRAASHDGPDSPGYMKPGRRAWVDHLHLYENRIEVPLETVSPLTVSRIREAVLKAYRLPPSPERYRLSLIEPVPLQHELLAERT